MSIELVKTGIPGLDKLLNGRVPKTSNLLLTGAPGTGKTLMALQFAYNGVKQFDENGVFITTEESLDNLREHSKQIGMDLGKYEKSGKLFLFEMDLATLKGGMASIKGLLDLIKKKKIKRFSLDSLIMFEYLYQSYRNDDVEFRRQILLFLNKIRAQGVTSMVISERKTVDFDKPHFTEMDFMFDGFVVISRIRKGSYFERVLTVAKMRGVDHSLDIHPIKIGKGGVTILTDQTPFSLADKEDDEVGLG
tara:strand:- start:2140 stop:2886 length:747 start_codon:yes stop_codon:yes gene_type:complete